jgi:HK97 family phage major capsid protein
MPLLEAEANKLSQETLERGVIEEIIDRDDLFALVPFMPIEGKAYLYNRENTISEGEFLDPYDDVPEGAASFTEVTTRLRILAGDVDLDKFLMTTQSDHNSQLAIQLASKAKALGRKFRRTLINGDNGANAKEFDGLAVLVPSEQTLIAGENGASVTLSMIDELRDLVKIAGGPDCLMMRRSTWRAFKALLRAMNGNAATEIMIENFGRPVPAIDGLPVILNDFIPIDEVQGTNAATTSIYAVRLNEADGFHGIVGNNMAGIAVEDIGTVQTKDAVRYRVKWYVGTALKSTLSVARLKGVTNI